MKLAIRAFIIILFLCYLVATIVKSDLWGNILSPIVTLVAFFAVYNALFEEEEGKSNRIIGLLLSLGLLTWVVADILWVVYDMGFDINPEDVSIITYCYNLTNLFIAIALTLYGIKTLRKWNIIQVLLDTVVISFLIIDLFWIIFMDENIKNIMLLKSDWSSALSIILDTLIASWVIIWYIAIRYERLTWFMRVMATGVLLFAITDLIYYYEYLFNKYEPNTVLDVGYVTAFWLIAIAAILRRKSNSNNVTTVPFNAVKKGKGYLLLTAPLLLIIFNEFTIQKLFNFIFLILVYSVISSFIQNNIQREILLHREQELNNELEIKVKRRTDELEEKNKVLLHLLDQDFVTGLKNGRFLLSYLQKTINELKDDETIVLLYIDINRFKMITTMFGHYTGDMILYKMAEKLKPLEKQAEHTMLTSEGDDTFIFTAVGHYDYKSGYEFAQEAINLCSDIYNLDDYQISITVNVGISLYPTDASTKEELIKHGDIAMSQARNLGYNCIRVFDVDLSKIILRRNTIEIMLKKVDFNQEFMVYYQPQLRTGSKELIGFEALLRWKSSTGEMIGPSEFIPIAEETGHILPIGEWVMTMAMKQMHAWNCMYHKKIMIGINVSIKQLNSLQFIDGLKEKLNRLKIDPECIDLEITETLQPQEHPEVLIVLENIRKLGIRISIDDFGTGYSSLSYLKSIPADRIKLAKELIDSVHMDNFDYELVKAIIQLSKAKGIKVIAEGVETFEQWETLKKLLCDEVQGYYFGKPAPADIVEANYLSIFK